MKKIKIIGESFAPPLKFLESTPLNAGTSLGGKLTKPAISQTLQRKHRVPPKIPVPVTHTAYESVGWHFI